MHGPSGEAPEVPEGKKCKLKNREDETFLPDIPLPYNVGLETKEGTIYGDTLASRLDSRLTSLKAKV